MQTPFEHLEPILREDIQKVIFYFFLTSELFFWLRFLLFLQQHFSVTSIPQIWDAVPKPQAHKYTPLSEFFNVRSLSISPVHVSLLLFIFVSVYISHIYD